jgi:hypothetical protein
VFTDCVHLWLKFSPVWPVKPSQGKSSQVQPNKGVLEKKIIFSGGALGLSRDCAAVPTLALTIMLDFKSLTINDVVLVVLYMRICHISILPSPDDSWNYDAAHFSGYELSPMFM